MKVLLVIILFLAGCVPTPIKKPYDPLYDLCMTTDFSHHTDQELHACGAWLKARQPVVGAGWQQPSVETHQPKTYTIIKPNGKSDVLSCYGATCDLLP